MTFIMLQMVYISNKCFSLFNLTFRSSKNPEKKSYAFHNNKKIILIELFLKDHLAQVMAAEMLKYNIF